MTHRKSIAVACTILIVLVFGSVAVTNNASTRERTSPTQKTENHAKTLKTAPTSISQIKVAKPQDTYDSAPQTKAVTQQDSYDQLVLSDHPAAFWPLNTSSAQENDLTSNSSSGVYIGGPTETTSMPNGDAAVTFDGNNQYVSIPSNAAFSVTTTNELTWEGWIKPTTLQFAHASSTGYVEWMGKCLNYSPSCEWTTRMYNAVNSQDRCDRLSAYIFNASAGLGSGAFWQPACNAVKANDWLYVVGEYDDSVTPPGCNPAYPGSINIWVDGVEWNQKDHAPTGCMSEYNVQPKAGDSPVTIGTASRDTWFQGAIGKVAIYNYLLSSSQIAAHYNTMTGSPPNGSCDATCTSASL